MPLRALLPLPMPCYARCHRYLNMKRIRHSDTTVRIYSVQPSQPRPRPRPGRRNSDSDHGRPMEIWNS
jgi:hypothetical protein